MAKALKKVAKKVAPKKASAVVKPSKTPDDTPGVDAFMKTLDHPLKKEVEAVRRSLWV